MRAYALQSTAQLLTVSLNCHRIPDRDGHQVLSCFEGTGVYRLRLRKNLSDRNLRYVVPAGSRVVGINGQFRLDPSEVSGRVLRTGVMRCKHVPHSWITFQEFRACYSDLMDYDICAFGVFDEVLVRRHVSGNDRRMSSVVNSEAECIFKILGIVERLPRRKPG